jgi:hypothetical protein
MAIRRMADASIALAERRPDDLKAAVERLGQQAPSAGQLRMLRVLGFVAPGSSAPMWKRARGVLSIIIALIVIVAVGALLAKLLALPFGGVGTAGSIWLGLLITVIALGVLVVVGRRRQARAKAKQAASAP